MATYRLRVHTGDVRGAGIVAKVFVQLHGDKGSAPRAVLGGGLGRFTRGSYMDEVLHTDFELGNINRLELGVDPADSEANEDGAVGWYLDRVEVTLLGGDALTLTDPVVFSCTSWIGQRDKERATRRVDSDTPIRDGIETWQVCSLLPPFQMLLSFARTMTGGNTNNG